MKILYIDTTKREIKVVLFNDGNIYSEKKDSMYHSLYLLDVIENVLKKANTDLGSIDSYCVNKGPGSFTGTRVGILTGLGFGRIYGKKVFYVEADTDINTIPDLEKRSRDEKQAMALYDSKSYFE